MTSVYTLSIFTLLILCTMYSNVMARCRWACWRSCYPFYPYGCRVYCGVRCTWGKRSVSDEQQNQLPFPNKFENYDLDKNGGITLEELAQAIRVDEHVKETVEAFKRADKNDDGQIDCSEFKHAPYLFEDSPTCPTTPTFVPPV